MTEGIHRQDVPALVIAHLALAVGLLFFADNPMRVDEQIHFDQISRLLAGPGPMNPTMTMIPGYHTIVALFIGVTRTTPEFGARLATVLLSLAAVWAFYFLARASDPESSGLKLVQFVFLPILFPQFFLVYTDVAALLFVLLMMLATVRRQYQAAGMLGLASCLMRQSNIVWVVFAMAWSYLRDNGWKWIPLRELIDRYWTFIATGVAFVLFVVANRGQIALGDVTAHPISLRPGNVFFLLFLSFFFYLPLWWGYRQQCGRRLASPWVWAIVVVVLPIFWIGFVADHPFNQDAPGFYIRNGLLQYFSASAARKLLFFIPAALALVFFTAVPVRQPWWVLFVFTVLALVPEWLIEQRYYLIPMSLFLIARKPASRNVERVQTALFVVASVALFVCIERNWRWM